MRRHDWIRAGLAWSRDFARMLGEGLQQMGALYAPIPPHGWRDRAPDDHWRPHDEPMAYQRWTGEDDG